MDADAEIPGGGAGGEAGSGGGGEGTQGASATEAALLANFMGSPA